MNKTLRKFLSVLIILVVVVGWYFTICGAGKDVKSIKDLFKFGLDINGGVYVLLEADTDLTGAELEEVMEQTRAVMNNRVNAMGLSEATVSIEGDKRIRVEMPGVENAEEAIQQIGRTAQLNFVMADGTVVMTGSDVSGAAVDTDTENGGYKIKLELTSDGATKFAEATEKALAGTVQAIDGYIAQQIIIMLDNEVVVAPVVHSVISDGKCEITSSQGGYTQEQATNTAALIRGGALPVPLQEISSSVQTATIGADALSKSIIAGAIGLLLVFLLMILAYNVLGLLADIALALYVLLVMWIMVGLDAVLTLPGIAGIILGIGMAVDANVIIFARIKEEIGAGKTVRVAVSQGFRHATVTVFDAQITTLIAAVVLYEIGSTSVKGFATTLMIGIVVSIVTAVFVTQVLVGLLADSKTFGKNKFFGCKEDGTPKQLIKRTFRFIQNRKIAYCISGGIILVGIVLTLVRGFNYGIDFTGGTMMQVDMGQTVEAAQVEEALAPLELKETVVLTGSNQDQVIIKTTKALDNAARTQVIDALAKNYDVTSEDILSAEQFGPTVGRELKTNALKSVGIAAVCMLIYIIFRFKSWKYGVSSILGIVHDVLVVLALYAVFYFTINNPFIAGILTIVGYSINDTIVIFDRIRENRKLPNSNKEGLEATINRSINQTLNRSIMTSLTTLCCMLPLAIMVSTSIREFVIPLMAGVLIGTYSSIFLCSPLLYEFSKKEGKSSYTLKKEKQDKERSKKK